MTDGESIVKVSIIVPIYNVEKYIRQCIDSILNQSMKDWELILVDDGSEDSSGNIADEYAAVDSRISVIHKKNGGASSARNAGLDVAQGEYICFVDSDDWIEEDYLKHLYEACVMHHADVTVCGYKECNGEIVKSVISGGEKNTPTTGKDAINRLYTQDYISTVVVWNKLYAGKLFERIRFPEGMIHEDEVVCPEILYEADTIVFVDNCEYNYRVDNTTSVMRAKYSLKHLDMLKALELRMDFFKEKDLRLYYEKDSFKYLYKILLNIIDIKQADNIDNAYQVIKELKSRYWYKYRESLRFSWSIRRKAGMFIFGVFPKLYMLRYKK